MIIKATRATKQLKKTAVVPQPSQNMTGIDRVMQQPVVDHTNQMTKMGYKTAKKDSRGPATEPKRDRHRQGHAAACGRSHKPDDENAENVTKSDISNKCAGQET